MSIERLQAEVARLTEALAEMKQKRDTAREHAVSAESRAEAAEHQATRALASSDEEYTLRKAAEQRLAAAELAKELKELETVLDERNRRVDYLGAEVARLTQALGRNGEELAEVIRQRDDAHRDIARLTEALTESERRLSERAEAYKRAEAAEQKLAAAEQQIPRLCNECYYTHRSDEPHGRRRDVY